MFDINKCIVYNGIGGPGDIHDDTSSVFFSGLLITFDLAAPSFSVFPPSRPIGLPGIDHKMHKLSDKQSQMKSFPFTCYLLSL